MSLGVLTLGAAATLAAVAWGPDAPSAGGLSFEVVRGPGAESCPDEEALRARAASHLAHPFGSPGAPVADRVSIEIVRSERGYLATVSALGFEGGTRRLVDTGEDCAGLAEALTLMLSLIADGRPLPAAKPPMLPEPARPSRPWELGAGALGATGILGAPSLGITLDVTWHPWPRIASGITALWMPSRGIQRGPGQSQVSLVAGLASVCWGILPFGGRSFPALCGLMGAGALHGESTGYLDARSLWRPWLTAGASVSLGIRLHRRLTLALDAGRLFSLRDEQFTIGGLGQIYQSGDPGWTGTAEILLRIP